jgi:hypothetical protein
VQSQAAVTVALLVALGIGFAVGILGSKPFPPPPTTIHGEEVFNLRSASIIRYPANCARAFGCST